MDLQLRQLERQLQTAATYENLVQYITRLFQLGDNTRLLEILGVCLPSQLLEDGSLLVRLGSRHIVINTEFDFFEVDPIITQAMAGFAVRDPVEVIGSSYPLPIDIDGLQDVELRRANTVNHIDGLLDPSIREELVERIIDISHNYLQPIHLFRLATQLMGKLKSWGGLADTLSELIITADTPNQSLRLTVIRMIIAYNAVHLSELMSLCSRNYAELIGLRPRISLAKSQAAGKDSYIITDNGEQKLLPNYFDQTSFTTALAELAIPNIYNRIVADSAIFHITQKIDYDWLTVTCKRNQATIAIAGNGSAPNQVQWGQFRVNQYDNDEGVVPVIELAIKPWPISKVLAELAAIIEFEQIEQSQPLTITQLEQLSDNLYEVATAWGYPYTKEELEAKEYFIAQDMDSQGYPNRAQCSPCYTLQVTTASGDTFFTNTDAIYNALKILGLSGSYSGVIWLQSVINSLDLSQPKYWIPI